MVLGLLNGPLGLLDCKHLFIEKNHLASFRNQGGFDLLGSSRTKIETAEQFQKALETCSTLKLDGLVIVGGDDSNTNAAMLAEECALKNVPTRIIGVPKTIDGDLQSEELEISF